MARAPKTAPILETERLRLRPFRAGDLKALHALYSDVENLRWWGIDPSPSLDETRRMMRWHLAYHPFQYVLWAVEEKKSKRLIGMINYIAATCASAASRSAGSWPPTARARAT